MIKTVDLHKSFDTKDGKLHVLKGVTEHIAKGEVVSIIGPSGGGKSTFLRCLNLLETPDSGQIFFEGTPVRSFSRARRSRTRTSISMSTARRWAWCSSILTCSRT